MGTTSAIKAADLLDALGASGLDFGLLHGEDAILDGHKLTDIDVVMSCSLDASLTQIASVGRAIGLELVTCWHYDTDSSSLFFADARGEHGVQLDVLHGTGSRGKYAVRVEVMIEGVALRRRWPCAREIDSALYLLSKRLVKGDYRVLKQLTSTINVSSKREAMHGRISDLFAPARAKQLHALIDRGRLPRRTCSGRWVLWNMRRLLARIVTPAGYWVHLVGADAEIAQQLAARFSGWLVVTRSGYLPASPLAQPRWYARDVAPVRYRAGLYVSWSDRRQTGRADAVVDGRNVDVAAQQTVAALASRFR